MDAYEISTKALRVKMAEKFITISQLSKETGLSRTTLTAIYYEKAHGIQYNTLIALCLRFKCQPGDLIEVERKEGLNVLPRQSSNQTDGIDR